MHERADNDDIDKNLLGRRYYPESGRFGCILTPRMLMYGDDTDCGSEASEARGATLPDQPPPVSNANPAVWPEVIEFAHATWSGRAPALSRLLRDMSERDQVGRARYGTPLQPHNGRDALVDLYQELLDAGAYAGQGLLEHPGSAFWIEQLRWVVGRLILIRCELDRQGRP